MSLTASGRFVGILNPALGGLVPNARVAIPIHLSAMQILRRLDTLTGTCMKA